MLPNFCSIVMIVFMIHILIVLLIIPNIFIPRSIVANILAKVITNTSAALFSDKV